MGIYDRDYYREESQGWWSSAHGHRATWTLIGITVGVFFCQMLTFHKVSDADVWTDSVAQWLGYSYPDLLKGQVWRLAFTPFIHSVGSLFGVGFGMFCLYWFGTSLEELYGAHEFAVFYCLVGLLGALGKFAVGLVGLDPSSGSLGCGPPMTAVLVLFACHFPYHRIRIYFLIPVPAWLLATLGVAFSVFGVFTGSFDPVPNLIAAALAFAYFKAQSRILHLLPSFSRTTARKPKLRVIPRPADDPEPLAASPPMAKRSQSAEKNVDEQLEAKLDEVLEKVARFGREGLTAEERDILQRASEVYRKRRTP